MILFHVTSEKMAKRYRESGFIRQPVRGFDTMLGAMAWAIKVNRKVIYLINEPDESVHKLPDHHNQWGQAWWVENNVREFRCVYSAEKDG